MDSCFSEDQVIFGLLDLWTKCGNSQA